MTRLPHESRRVRPRLDLPAYKLNTVCPITGLADNLEDHHIWRRSFTALGSENQDLYWVELYVEYADAVFILPNRVNLHSMAHERITTNRATLEFDEKDSNWYYTEGDTRTRVPLGMRLVTPFEDTKPHAARRPKTKTPKEPARNRATYSVRVPKDASEDGAEILEQYVDRAREYYREERGWTETVPSYFPLESALYDWQRVFIGGEAP